MILLRTYNFPPLIHDHLPDVLYRPVVARVAGDGLISVQGEVFYDIRESY